MNKRHEKAAKNLEALKAKALAGESPLGMNVVIPSAEIIDIASLFDFDWMAIDTEHTLIQGSKAIADLLRAVEIHSLPVIVKPNAADPLLIRDAMDAGAHGVLLPFIRSAAHLSEISSQCRFAPLGDRGICGLSRATDYFVLADSSVESYIEFINEHMLFVPMIEDMDGVENIDEILEVPGFDVFHVGFADLMISLRQEGKDAGYMLRLAEMLCKKIHDAGKIVMGNVELREPLEGRASNSAHFHNLMPYVTDTTLLAYACERAMETNKLSKPLLKPLLK